MLTRSWRTRTCAAVVVAIALAGGTVSAQGKSGSAQTVSLQPVGTMQITAMGGTISPLYGFGFAVTNSATAGSGSGGGAGKAVLSEVVVTRLPDAASPLLFKNAVLGAHLPAVQITMFGSGKAIPEASYTLSDVLISAFSSEDGVERVSFSYEKIEMVIGGSRACSDTQGNVNC